MWISSALSTRVWCWLLVTIAFSIRVTHPQDQTAHFVRGSAVPSASWSICYPSPVEKMAGSSRVVLPEPNGHVPLQTPYCVICRFPVWRGDKVAAGQYNVTSAPLRVSLEREASTLTGLVEQSSATGQHEPSSAAHSPFSFHATHTPRSRRRSPSTVNKDLRHGASAATRPAATAARRKVAPPRSITSIVTMLSSSMACR